MMNNTINNAAVNSTSLEEKLQALIEKYGFGSVFGTRLNGVAMKIAASENPETAGEEADKEVLDLQNSFFGLLKDIGVLTGLTGLKDAYIEAIAEDSDGNIPSVEAIASRIRDGITRYLDIQGEWVEDTSLLECISFLRRDSDGDVYGNSILTSLLRGTMFIHSFLKRQLARFGAFIEANTGKLGEIIFNFARFVTGKIKKVVGWVAGLIFKISSFILGAAFKLFSYLVKGAKHIVAKLPKKGCNDTEEEIEKVVNKIIDDLFKYGESPVPESKVDDKEEQIKTISKILFAQLYSSSSEIKALKGDDFCIAVKEFSDVLATMFGTNDSKHFEYVAESILSLIGSSDFNEETLFNLLKKDAFGVL